MLNLRHLALSGPADLPRAAGGADPARRRDRGAVGRGYRRIPAGQRPADPAGAGRLQAHHDRQPDLPRRLAPRERTARPAWRTCSSTCCSRARPSTPRCGPSSHKRGLAANGSTSFDRTNYTASFSANDDNLQWYLGWLADSMVNSFIAREDLDTEMTVVRNEMESGENSPQRILVAAHAWPRLYDWHNYGRVDDRRAQRRRERRHPAPAGLLPQLLPARQRDADRLRQVRPAARAAAGCRKRSAGIPARSARCRRSTRSTRCRTANAASRCAAAAACRCCWPATTCRRRRTSTSPPVEMLATGARRPPRAGCTSS